MLTANQHGTGSMELFKNTNFDFLGKKWPFIIASLILTVAGLVSLAIKGGPRYGIEFKGGMLMTVKFAGTPPLDQIRSAFLHAQQIKGEVSVQNITDVSTKNEIAIGTGRAPTNAQLNEEPRSHAADTLATTFGQPDNGKLDLNNASAGCAGRRLRDAAAARGRRHERPIR